MTADEAKTLAKTRLGPKRFYHTESVAKAAQALALRWGADAQKAVLAAWLHDLLKEAEEQELLRLLAPDGIIKRPRPVWHGPAAAVYARQYLGVTDAEVLSAVACHTTGKAGMSLLDKILFLADAIGEDRRYDGAEALRRLAQIDLDAAVTAVLEESLRWLRAKGFEADGETQAALAAMGEV